MGRISCTHAIKVDEFFVFDSEGAQTATGWSSYIKKYIDSAVTRHRKLPYSLGDDLIDKIEKNLYALADYKPTDLSVTHGDLHGHNVLVKNDSLILFDKFADFPVAPAAFDIGLLYAESFWGRCFSRDGVQHQ
jgi:5-methylthioribose kinase